MNCRQISSNLSAYLDHELSTGEERQVVDHITTCEACRLELAELRKTRLAAKSAMQLMAASAEPSAQAWADLQHRIEQENGSSIHSKTSWLSNLAPGWLVNTIQTIGATQMSRRVAVVVSGALIIGILGFFMMDKTVTPVSAKQILDKAYEVQMNANQATGISHLKVERYFNQEMAEGKDAGFRLLSEIYTDYKTGNYRMVEYFLPETKVRSVSGYDGENTYSSIPLEKSQKEEILTVYRSPQSRDKVAGLDNLGPIFSAQQEFDSIRNDPKISLESENEQKDGRKVYVLVTNHPADLLKINEKEVQRDPYLERMIFDAKTYELLETETVVKKNGKEIILSSLRFLARENLPADAKVNWDMSDLKGIKIENDLDRTKGDLLPEKITREELGRNSKNAYLLERTPQDFDLTITAAPNKKQESYYAYTAMYKNAAGKYFYIQPIQDEPVESFEKESVDIIEMKDGMKAYIYPESKDPVTGEVIQLARIKVTEKYTIFISSSLPLDDVKNLMDSLERVK